MAMVPTDEWVVFAPSEHYKSNMGLGKSGRTF